MVKTKSSSIEIIEDILKNIKYTVPFEYELNHNDIFKLVQNGFYDKCLDGTTIYEFFFTEVHKYFIKNGNKALNDSEIVELGKQIDLKLSSYPQEYVFTFLLPRNYTFDKVELLKNVTIGRIYGKNNPSIPSAKSKSPKSIKDLIEIQSQQKKKNINFEDSYFIVECRGAVSNYGDFSVLPNDPLYLFKIFIAIHCLTGSLIIKNEYENNIFEEKLSTDIFVLLKDFSTYRNISTFAEDLAIINKLRFKNSSSEQFEISNNVFSLLLGESKKETKKIRIQILNSLFWYFEILRTDNQNLKTVFTVTAFDSFFTTDENSKLKRMLISSFMAESIQFEKDLSDVLSHLYDKRNKIIHGQMPIYSNIIDEDGERSKQKIINRGAEIFLKNYLHKKIQIFLKSAAISTRN